ncbi:MAG: hypothetical protein U1C49_02710 [Candidatus Andersenbacteria bacterium]|nr:hypothetical protein [bacterium]MDZ4225738.1 hypothetical protein [Candidatus Andersenbacteria bacterium]
MPASKTARRWTINFVTGAFAIALALLYVLVLRSIAIQITPPPQPLLEAYPDTSTRESCQAAGGRWVPETSAKNAPQRLDENSPAVPSAYCQGPLTIDRQREAQTESSRQTTLFVFAIGGALAVTASLLLKQLKPVAPGLMIGGIVAFFVAGTQIWMMSPGWGRLVTIIAIFVILIGVGLYAFREQDIHSN